MIGENKNPPFMIREKRNKSWQIYICIYKKLRNTNGLEDPNMTEDMNRMITDDIEIRAM